jgi:hypothetical protein
MCTGVQWLLVNVWGDPVERPPYGKPERPKAVDSLTAGWIAVPSYKVRFVRVQVGGTPPPGMMNVLSVPAAMSLVVRGFDLLARPADDIAEAPLGVWNTSLDVNDRDDRSELLTHLHDQHNCSFFEWLGFDDDECPDDDGAAWIGLLPRDVGGATRDMSWPTYTHNTCVAGIRRTTIAHELGHTLALNHVNPNLGCPTKPEDPYDLLPNNGLITARDTFDPDPAVATSGTAVQVVPAGQPGLFDVMSYACTKWISRFNWFRMIQDA